MKTQKLNSNISRHLQENLWLYILCLLCLFTGIVLGFYTVKYMGDMERQDLINYFLSFKGSIKSVDIDKKFILLETIKNNLPVIAAMWILGLTIVGIPVILIIDIAKGFTLGFTLCLIFNSIGTSGFWFTFVGLIPQNIIYLPCIIIGSVLSIKLSLTKLKSKVNKYSVYDKKYIVSYSASFIIIFLMMILGLLYEVYVTPNAIKAIAMSLGSGLLWM